MTGSEAEKRWGEVLMTTTNTHKGSQVASENSLRNTPFDL